MSSFSFLDSWFILMMHKTSLAANSLSITSSTVASAAALIRHAYRRHLNSAFSSETTFLKPILYLTPKNIFANFSTKIKPNRMPILSAASLSSTTTPSPVEPMPSPSVEPDKPKAKPPRPEPWLIVGLGNPGKNYNSTRHNVGFEMVDKIAEAEGISMSSISFKALFGKGFIGDVPIMLAKPQTFMNASGESVGAIVSYYKLPLKQVLVIYDDMDLPFARLRLLPKGGHGGHNGMKSIINHLKGSRDFPRLRIGIGRPPGKMDPVNFVLRRFSKEEHQELDLMFENGSEAVRILLLEGFDKSATFVNSAKRLEYDC